MLEVFVLCLLTADHSSKVSLQTTSFIFSHRHMRGAAMSLTAAVRGFVVVVFVSVVQGQSGWGVTYTSTHICAVKGSTVNIHCTYTHPERSDRKYFSVLNRLWFTKNNKEEPVDLESDSDYSGRVKYQFNNKASTLTIRDLRQSDSAEYKFRFITNLDGKYTGVPGVTLSVTDLQVEVITSEHQQRYTVAELKCHSRCSPGHSSYVWIKNGQQMLTETTSSLSYDLYPTDSISCALKGQEKFPSPSVYAPKLPSVSVSPSAEIVEDSSVTLTCSSDANPAADYTWYKKNGLKPLSEDSQLVFRSIQFSDFGEYYCTAGNKLGMKRSGYKLIDVKYAPKLPSVSVSPSAEIVEGSSVTLTCSSDANPAADYTWYKEDEDSSKASGQNFTITDIRPEHSGNYYCVAQNSRRHHNSTLVLITVAGKSVIIMNIIRFTLLILMLIPLLVLSLCMRIKFRKKKPIILETVPNECVGMTQLNTVLRTPQP